MSPVAYGLLQISNITFSANPLCKKLKMDNYVIRSSESLSSKSFSSSKYLISSSPDTLSIYFETKSSSLSLI